MLFGISFTAKPGKEAALEKVLSDKDVIKRVTEHMGASLEAVFIQGSRFTEVFDLPHRQGIARDKILKAHGQPEVRAFLARFGPLLDDPFNPEDPTSFAAWLQRHKMRLVFDARVTIQARPAPAAAPAAAPAPAEAPGPAAPPLAMLPTRLPRLAPAKASFERVAMGAAPR